MNGDSFWMVWNIARDVPRCQHYTEQAAIAEAERLARINPGQSFYVVEATHLLVKDDVKRIRLTPAEFTPF